MATKKKETELKTVATPAETLWNNIKRLPLEIFALPNQTVENHVTREANMEKVYPETIHLTLKSPAVLPALEETLGKVRVNPGESIVIDNNGRYTTVTLQKN
ncbi:MAG: hypothetical protein WC942_01130 [Clostridia bacterium]|jgi:hypothetical protein